MKIVGLPQKNFEEFIAHPCDTLGLKMLDIVLGVEHKAMGLSGDLLQKVRESIDDLTRLVREDRRRKTEDRRPPSVLCFPFSILNCCEVSHGTCKNHGRG